MQTEFGQVFPRQDADVQRMPPTTRCDSASVSVRIVSRLKESPLGFAVRLSFAFAFFVLFIAYPLLVMQL